MHDDDIVDTFAKPWCCWCQSFKGDLQLIMVDDYWSQVDDCWFIVSSCCWRKDFSNTLWFFMISDISDILSGSSFTNVLRVLVKILTHFVLVMSRTVFATTTCVWQIDTSDIAGIIVMVRVELVPWPEGTSPKKHTSHLPKLREV